jgi:hypothetical protein
MTSLLLLLLACSSAPKLTSAQPEELVPGAELTIMGEALEGGSITLVGVGGPVAIPTTGSGSVVLLGTLPEELVPGSYDVVVDVGGVEATLTRAVMVKPLRSEEPCSEEYTANTQLSLARKVVVVDRFWKDGERETVRANIDEIERVEYELMRRKDGKLCSAVYMKRTDGTRLLFADDGKVDLKQRAYMLGRDMSKPVDVVREDAPGMVDAAADGE